jgi:hypothetical protein
MARFRGLMVIVILSTLLRSFGPDVAAQEGTPVTADTTGVTEQMLFSWTIAADALPGDELESVFYRLTLPSGASLPLLAGPFCG